MTVLTSERLIEVQEMRPIDKLFNILVKMGEQGKRNQGEVFSDFMDFADSHTM